MADAASNWFEIERRNIMFKSTTTLPDESSLGYDGDPNNVIDGHSDGETLIYNSPIATMYCQDNGTMWRKKSLPNEWVIIGGGSTCSTIVGCSVVANETPLGSINGTNNVFTLLNTPISGSVSVYLNGLQQKPYNEDYTVSGTQIIFVNPPLSGDTILCNYFITTSGCNIDHNTLNNLDYDSSGHTGFASTAQLTTTSGLLYNSIGIDEVYTWSGTGAPSKVTNRVMWVGTKTGTPSNGALRFYIDKLGNGSGDAIFSSEPVIFTDVKSTISGINNMPFSLKYDLDFNYKYVDVYVGESTTVSGDNESIEFEGDSVTVKVMAIGGKL